MAKKSIRNNGPFAKGKTLNNKDKKKLREFNEQEKGNFTTPGSEKDQAELKAFQAEIDKMNMDMLDFHNRGQAWMKKNQNEKKDAFQAFNDVYQRRMLMMCILPLQRGVDAQSLAQAAGMVVGLMIVNKEFRQNVHQAIADYKINKAGGPNKYMQEAEKNPKLVNSINKHLLKAHDGRIPFTEQSAAAMNISLAKQAYEMYREPDSDKDMIKRNYEKARNTLYELSKADGISEEELDVATKTMYGRLSNVDPSLREIYKETAYREIVLGDMKKDTYIQYDENGVPTEHERNVWQGSYKDLKSNEEFSGMFNVRESMDMNSFEENLKNDVSEYLNYVDPKDFSEFGNSVMKNLFEKYGKDFPNDLEYDERVINHLSAYFEMGEVDGLKPSGDFNNIKESLNYYSQTKDKSKMGMAERYYVSTMEAMTDYARKSPEHMQAVSDWGKEFEEMSSNFTKETQNQRRPANDTIDYSQGGYDYGYGSNY